MSKRFNPYHAWLGIPAEDQPPNHYRLLGIPLFEANEDVIQNGLDQRMAHVKSFANGPRADYSQRLLTEISQAGVCLLRPEKKRTYDKQLRSKLKADAETVQMPVQEAAVAPPPAASQPPQQSSSPRAAVEPAAPLIQTSATDEPVDSGFPIVPTIVGSAIGLGVAGLVLLLLSGGKITNTVAGNAPSSPPVEGANGEGNTELQVDVSDPLDEGDPEVEAQPNRSDAPADEAGLQSRQSSEPPPPESAPSSKPAASPFQAADSSPPASWPSTLPGSPPPSSQSQSTGQASRGSIGSTPQNSSPNYGTVGGSSTTLKGKPQSLVLDLERSVMYVVLEEDVEGKVVKAQLRGITNLTTPYDLEPADGIISIGQPMDVVLTQYAGVKIRLSIRTRANNAELEIAPEIETGPGKTSDFSKRTLDRASRAMKKDYAALGKQLAAAQNELLMIQNAMGQPAPAPVRTAQRQRLNALISQSIPALQQQIAYIQTRSDVIQQFSVLAERIHDKASLDLVIQVDP